MKFNSLTQLLTLAVAAALAALPADASAQGASGTAGASTTSGSGAAKPLAQGDKKFVKDAAEAHLDVLNLTGITRGTGPGSEETKKESAKLGEDLNKVWGELGTIAGAHKVEMPGTEVKGADKSALEKLKKAKADEFEKDFYKSLAKQTKKTVRVYEMAAKSVQDPELKALVEKTLPTVKAQNDEVEKMEEAAAKKK